MAVRSRLPEKLVAGQPSTSHCPISGFTPRIAEKLWGYLVTSLASSPPKESHRNALNQRESPDLGSLGHDLEQLEKPPNRRRLKGVLRAKSPAKEAQGQVPKNKNPARNHPQNTTTKITRKSSKNHQEDKRETQHKALRNHAESFIHTMKVHTRSSLPPGHLFLPHVLTMKL
jgi:hypothetical protein